MNYHYADFRLGNMLLKDQDEFVLIDFDHVYKCRKEEEDKIDLHLTVIIRILLLHDNERFTIIKFFLFKCQEKKFTNLQKAFKEEFHTLKGKR